MDKNNKAIKKSNLKKSNGQDLNFNTQAWIWSTSFGYIKCIFYILLTSGHI